MSRTRPRDWSWGVVALGLLIGSCCDVRAADLDQARCLASTMSGEARGEGERGMLAVADVVLNRVESGGYSGTVCEVVRQRRQFDGYGHAYTAEQLELALAAMAGRGRGLSRGATFFTAVRETPYWRAAVRVTTVIGHHVFYRPMHRAR